MSEATRRIAARLKRVEEHLSTLERLFDAFVQDETAYRVEAKQRPNSKEIAVWGEVLRLPPVIEWAPVLSDVHNGIRGSLDNTTGVSGTALGVPRRSTMP